MEGSGVNRLIIIGAGGHGKVIADIAKKNGYEEIVFLDNDPQLKENAGYPVLGPDGMAGQLAGDLFIAVGNAAVRKRLTERYKERIFPVLIHPDAVVADSVRIGEGTAVMAGAVLNPCARIGKGCIINTCSSVDHDCVLEEYTHLAVGAHLCGSVTVGAGTWIGAGAVVSNNISICGGSMIGAGTVVIRDITEAGTWIGVPARRIKTGE